MEIRNNVSILETPVQTNIHQKFDALYDMEVRIICVMGSTNAWE